MNKRESFSAVRRAFNTFCANQMASVLDCPPPEDIATFMRVWKDDMPQELIIWYESSDQSFGKFLNSKLGPYLGMLDTSMGRKSVFNKMLDGVADDPQFFNFLAALEDHECINFYFDYLRTLTALAMVLWPN